MAKKKFIFKLSLIYCLNLKFEKKMFYVTRLEKLKFKYEGSFLKYFVF